MFRVILCSIFSKFLVKNNPKSLTILLTIFWCLFYSSHCSYIVPWNCTNKFFRKYVSIDIEKDSGYVKPFFFLIYKNLVDNELYRVLRQVSLNALAAFTLSKFNYEIFIPE